MPSVVIAAHNESAVLGSCLDAVTAAGVEVIVVANGCVDDTAAIARARGVQVIELAEASKARALNAGDAAATTFPRFYVDADIVLSPNAIAEITKAMAATGALAAVPRRELELAGRPLLVRAYYAIHRRLPAMREGLFGRGVIAVSETGRARFDRFPELTADDLFLDSQFGLDERIVADAAASVVRTPVRSRDLVRRLARVRAGNAVMRAAGPHVRRARPLSWLTDVVARAPWLAPAALGYVTVVVLAQRQARRGGDRGWARDESSRVTSER